MKKAKAAGKKSSKKVRSLPRESVPEKSVPEKDLKPVDLGVVREQITNLVGNRAVAMVVTSMAEVDKGHYLAMKYLFEMIGLCPATASEGMIEEDSLAKTLLRRLKLPEEASPGTEVTKECGADPQEQASDAVK